MSNSQGRERKRSRDEFGPLGTNNLGARQDFPFRERLDSLTQKRSRSSWGGRTEWDNEHGQIPDRQISERDRDLRDAGWDKGLNVRGRGNGRDDSYFGSGRTSSGVSSSGLNGRDRGSEDNDHRWPSAGSRDGPFPSDGLYRSHSASEYENDRGSNTGDRWHGGYRDGFERDRVRRERDERDSMGSGPGSGSNQCRRQSPLYFEQPRGNSRERDKIREYSSRYQRSQSPHYSDSPPMRRPASSSGDGYSNSNFSKNYWSRSGGQDNSSSSSNKIRSLSPDYHPDDRDKIRVDSACRGSRSDGGRNGFGYDEFRGGGGGGGASAFDGYRRAVSPRDDNTGPGSSSGNGNGGGFGGSAGGHMHPSRDRHPPYVDNIDTERVGEARSRGSWPSPQGLNRGGFFGGRGGINRFGGHSIEGGGRGHSGFGVRNFSFQRRGAEDMRRPIGDVKPSSSAGTGNSNSSNSEKVSQSVSSNGNSSSGDIAVIGNGNGPGVPQSGDQEEGSDNMEIDTDTVEVMATPVRRQRVISDPDVRQFLQLREALMDYDLAKALCTIGVKPPAPAVTSQSALSQGLSAPSSEEERMQSDSVTESASKTLSDQPEYSDALRSNMRQSTPSSSTGANTSSSSSGSRTKDFGSQDSGMKSIRGNEGSTGREAPPLRSSTSNPDIAGNASRQPGQGRAPDRGSAVITSGIGRSAPLPPYPRGGSGSGSRTQPQPPSTTPPYNQQQYGQNQNQGQGQGQGHDYLYPPPSQQRIYLQNQNQSHSYGECYNYNRNNVGPRGSSDHLNQPNLNAQSHHIEEGRPRPPHGPPKGPGRGPQPPLPPVPAPPTR